MKAWIFFLAAVLPLQAQEEKKPHPGVDPFRVNQAIERGAKYLLIKRKDFREWEAPRGGSTLRLHDFILYTLFHADVDPETPLFQKLLKKVLESELETTYTVAVQAMFFQEFDAEKYRWRIAQCCQFLVDNQCRNGQWSYGEPTKYSADVPTFSRPEREDVATSGKKPGKKEKAPKPLHIRSQRTGIEKGDNSNSQYALLGLRACMEANIWPPRKTLLDSLDWWYQSMRPGGGWNYGNTLPVYGSMTVGAVGSMVILRHYMGKKWNRDDRVRKGLAWMGKNFTVTENPGKATHHYYYLYALERAGILTGLDRFGRHDWYREGANYILDNQKSNGSWVDVRNTCFAILFLKRATPPLKKVKTGAR